MKVSFFCSPAYLEPEYYVREERWPSRRGTYDPEIGEYSLEVVLQQAEEAESYGFDMVSVSEHHSTATTQSPNASVLAAALIPRVRHARIGVFGPLVSLANPVRVAEEISMLDVLSGGRVEVLPLRGTPAEFFVYGTNPKESRARTQEAVDLIERALSESEPFGWEGRFFRYPQVAVWPGTTQEKIPVWSSGNSFESMEFAAIRKQAACISFYPEHLVAELAEAYRTVAEANGWTPGPEHFLYRGFITVADTTEKALDMSDRMFSVRQRKSLSRFIGAGIATNPAAGAGPAAVTGPERVGTDADSAAVSAGIDGMKGNAEGFGLGRMVFGGTPDQVVGQIHSFYEATGVGTLDLAFNGGGLSREESSRSLELFGRKVLPAIRHLGLSVDHHVDGARVSRSQ